MIIQAVKWIGDIDGFLELIDQRRLPSEFVKIQCRQVDQLYEAIKTLAVRGAPAIGVAAAYGPVLALQKISAKSTLHDARDVLVKACEYLESARPTAVNLFWALERIKRVAASKPQVLAMDTQNTMSNHPQAALEDATHSQKLEGSCPASASATLQQLREVILKEANAIYQEDVDMCLRIGQNGERFIKDGFGILTHCNAGALATAGQGTALSVVFEAHKKGKIFKVYVDETRPLLQGARLTAWELKQAGIETILICDNMAGWLMKQGKIDMVLTGADRIAANGDTANKVGTYSLSILAHKHSIPFYIAAPSSTFDLRIKTGAEIPIEQRASDEVLTFAGRRIAPEGVDVYNPAFDVTEAKNITAIITDKGVIEKPNANNIREHLKPM